MTRRNISQELARIEKKLHEKTGWLAVRQYPKDLGLLVYRAEYNLLSYFDKRSLSAALKSASFFRKIVYSKSFEPAALLFKLDSLNRLGGVILPIIFRHNKKEEIAEESKTVLQQLIGLTPEGWPDGCNYLHNLSSIYLEEYNAYGDPERLDAAIGVNKNAINTAPAGHRNLELFYYNQINLLSKKYQNTGVLKYLDEAIETGLYSLKTFSTKRKLHRYTQSLVSSFYRQRYLRTKNTKDIDISIGLARKSIQLKKGKTDDEAIAGCLSNLGNALLEKSKIKGFEYFLFEASALQRKAINLTGKGHPSLAIRYNNLGNCYDYLFNRARRFKYLTKAIECYMKAMDSSSKNDPVLTTRYYNLAGMVETKFLKTRDSKDLTQAENLYEKACITGLKGYPEWALFSSLAWGNLMFMGNLYSRAIKAYSFGVKAIAQLYDQQFEDKDKNTWLKHATQLANKLAFSQIQCGKKTEAIVTLEQGLARNLREKLEQNQANLSRLRVQDPVLFEEFDSSLSLYKEGIQEKKGTELLAPLKRDIDRSLKKIRRLAGFENFLLPPNKEMVRQAMTVANDWTLIYLVSADEHFVAIVVNVNTKGHRIKVLQPEIDALQLKQFLTSYYIRSIESNETDLFKECLDTFWSPFSEIVQQSILPSVVANNIALVLTGFFDLLPFSSLLPFDKKVTVVPSLISFAQVLKDFNPDVYNNKLLMFSDTMPVEAPLEFARVELNFLKHYFNNDLVAYSAENATKQNLMKNISGVTYIHFACHSYFDWSIPLDSGIMLFDDVLRLKELMQMPAELGSTRLVILSSCQSGINDISELPDEAISFPAGFLLGGVPGIISSLWSVSDISTALLIKKFYYYHIVENKDPVSSLRFAQRWISQSTNNDLNLAELSLQIWESTNDRNMAQLYIFSSRNPEAVPFSHPYYWAGFYFTGI